MYEFYSQNLETKQISISKESVNWIRVHLAYTLKVKGFICIVTGKVHNVVFIFQNAIKKHNQSLSYNPVSVCVCVRFAN